VAARSAATHFLVFDFVLKQMAIAICRQQYREAVRSAASLIGLLLALVTQTKKLKGVIVNLEGMGFGELIAEIVDRAAVNW